jgi:hypothetical protein
MLGAGMIFSEGGYTGIHYDMLISGRSEYDYRMVL